MRRSCVASAGSVRAVEVDSDARAAGDHETAMASKHNRVRLYERLAEADMDTHRPGLHRHSSTT